MYITVISKNANSFNLRKAKKDTNIEIHQNTCKDCRSVYLRYNNGTEDKVLARLCYSLETDYLTVKCNFINYLGCPIINLFTLLAGPSLSLHFLFELNYLIAL